MKPLRIAVVGAGHLGKIHARILAGLEQFQLTAVVDPMPLARQAVAELYGATPLAHVRELPRDIDAAVVASPTRFHRDAALDLLERGVHLLIEKPLAASAADAAEIVAAARRQGAVLQVGHVERFNPAFAAARAHVARPRFIEAARRAPFSFRSTDIGVTFDLMIHDIDLTLALVRSPVVRVDALGWALFGKHEDLAQARIVFENGCVAQLAASRASRAATRCMEVWGERTMVQLDFMTRRVAIVRPNDAILGGDIDVERMSTAERGDLQARLFDDYLPEERFEAEPCDAITAELCDFADSIRAGRAPTVSGEQGLAAVTVAEQIVTAIRRRDAAQEREPLPAAQPHILRGPHWDLRPQPSDTTVRREAG